MMRTNCSTRVVQAESIAGDAVQRRMASADEPPNWTPLAAEIHEIQIPRILKVFLVFFGAEIGFTPVKFTSWTVRRSPNESRWTSTATNRGYRLYYSIYWPCIVRIKKVLLMSKVGMLTSMTSRYEHGCRDRERSGDGKIRRKRWRKKWRKSWL